MNSVFLSSGVKNCVRRGKYHKIFKEMLIDMENCVQRIRYGFCKRDLYDIDGWFLDVMPDMLLAFRDMSTGAPSRFLNNNGHDSQRESDRAVAEWRAVLTQMAFLFREANEKTCKKKNPYIDKYGFALYKFEERFGDNGKWVKKKDGTRVFIQNLSDIPKYKALEEKCKKAEQELWDYRKSCLKKALSMFAEYFNDLWF